MKVDNTSPEPVDQSHQNAIYSVKRFGWKKVGDDIDPVTSVWQD